MKHRMNPVPDDLREESAEGRRAVLDGLTVFNDAVTGARQDGGPLSAVLRDGPGGPILGGLIGYVYGSWLQRQLFHLPEPLRRQGWGRRLGAMLEDEARTLGAVGAHVDTFSFQARGFYERLGFTVYGTIEGLPPGHRRYVLFKRFTPQDGQTGDA